MSCDESHGTSVLAAERAAREQAEMARDEALARITVLERQRDSAELTADQYGLRPSVEWFAAHLERALREREADGRELGKGWLEGEDAALWSSALYAITGAIPARTSPRPEDESVDSLVSGALYLLALADRRANRHGR